MAFVAQDDRNLGLGVFRIFELVANRSDMMYVIAYIINMFSSEITSPTEARAGFFQLLDRVAQNHQVCIINRRDGENVALIAESDLNSLIETVYLFRSPTNASRLLDSLAEMKSGQLAPQSIEELQRELSISGEEEKQS
jgi:antitoxin YefM